MQSLFVRCFLPRMKKKSGEENLRGKVPVHIATRHLAGGRNVKFLSTKRTKVQVSLHFPYIYEYYRFVNYRIEIREKKVGPSPSILSVKSLSDFQSHGYYSTSSPPELFGIWQD